MEEEIIIPEEEVFNYHSLRYILDKDGYVCHASIGGLVICDLGECTEYTGDVPNNYQTIEEWYDGEIDKLNAWKIVEGNLVFDEIKYNEIEEQRKQDEIDNCCVTHKELYGLQKEIEDIQDVNNSQYTEASANGKIITIDNVKKVYPKVKIKNIDCYSFSKIDLIASGKNILPNEAVTQEISGVTFTQNEDRSITIDGTSTENIEYNIFGTNTNISPILVLKKDTNYYLSSNGYQIKMYNYDGTNREEVYSGTGGLIKFTDEDKLVTQIVLYIPKETTVKDITVYPQLEVGSTGTDYETYKSNMVTIDFSEYIEEGLFPSDNLFPSDDLFPKGTTIDYILIENGKAYIKVNENEEEIEVNKVHLFDGYNTIYTIQDTNIEINYCINNLKLEGTITKNGSFRVLEDGSIMISGGSDIHLFDGNKSDAILSIINGVGNFALFSSSHTTLSKDDKYSIHKPDSIAFTDDKNSSFLLSSGIAFDDTNGNVNAISTKGIYLTDGTNETGIGASYVQSPIITQTSLVEQKKNFEKFEDALPILNEIDIYKYNLKFEEDGHKKHLGFVIGEDYNYSSEITAVDKDGKEIGVDNYSMTSLCLQAIKELCNKVETLEEKIKELESDK